MTIDSVFYNLTLKKLDSLREYLKGDISPTDRTIKLIEINVLQELMLAATNATNIEKASFSDFSDRNT